MFVFNVLAVLMLIIVYCVKMTVYISEIYTVIIINIFPTD